MKIKWYGHSCFLIESDKGIKILTDPFENKAFSFLKNYNLPKLNVDIVTITHNHNDHNYCNGVLYKTKIDSLIFYSQNSIKIKGIKTFHDNNNGEKRGENIIYVYEIDNIKLCHCGDLGHLLSEKQLNEIGQIDILFIPVGGKFTIDAKTAIEVVKQINPKIIIPMHYRLNMGIYGYIFSKVDKFLKFFNCEQEKVNELNITKEDLKNIKEKIIVLNVSKED